MRLMGKPEKEVLDKVIAQDLQLLPKSIKIYEGSETMSETKEDHEFECGEGMKDVSCAMSKGSRSFFSRLLGVNLSRHLICRVKL